MGTGLFSIGVSGIKAAQMGLLATEHNVVNAGTAGYSRQATVQATNVSVGTGAGSIGQGVRVITVKRMYDDFLSERLNTAQTSLSQLDTLHTQLSQIDNMLADPNAGLSPALQQFFAGAQKVASDPSSLPARQSMISASQTLTSRFQVLDARLSELAEQTNGRIASAVSAINGYSVQIAELNERVLLAQGAYGQPPNDLLDQRDQLITELNKLVKVSVNENSDGTYNVFFGNGQQLVGGGRAVELTAQASSADLTRIAVGLKTPGGAQELPESMITGGELGGLLRFRSESLNVAKNELGRIATSLALTFNAQHQLGQDLMGNIAADGAFVGSYFSIPNPVVVANSRNTGGGSISVSFLPPDASGGPAYDGGFQTNLKSSDYQVAFAAGGAYTVTRLSDKQVVANGVGVGPVNLPGEGLTFDIGTVGGNGDRFIVKPYGESASSMEVNSRIAADPRLVAAAAPMRVDKASFNTGGMSIGPGVNTVGYSAAGLPQTLTASAGSLNGLAGNWTATYSDGTAVAGSGNIALTNGASALSNIEFSGMSFKVSGVPDIGDQFTFDTNDGAVQDGRNAVLFSNLQTQKTMDGGTASFQSSYAKLVADNGIQTREAKVRLAAQEAVFNQAQSARDSLSAVNLDEEAANMMKYQQAYQAAAKVLAIGGTLFETLLSIS